MAPIFKSLLAFGALLATTTTVAAAPVQQVKRASNCTKDSPCQGQVTYYQTATDQSAPSSCGYTNNGDHEDVVALPHGLMTEADCGKTVTIRYGPITHTGKVVDKCMGCDSSSIDLSKHLFSGLAELLEGRLFGVDWFME